MSKTTPNKLKGKDLSLLGKLSDVELAEKWGVSTTTIYLARRKNNIAAAPPKKSAKSGPPMAIAKEDITLLGTMTDEAAAKKLGVCVGTVISTRHRNKIHATRPWRKLDASKVDWSKSGREIAQQMGVTESAVSRARQRAGKRSKRGPEKGQGGRPEAPVPVNERPSWPQIFAAMEARQCTAGQALDYLLNG